MGLEVPAWMEGIVQQTISILDEAAWNELKRSQEMLRPCMMLKPALEKWRPLDDADEIPDESFRWYASYHDIGVHGRTPEEAYLNFDKAWKGEMV